MPTVQLKIEPEFLGPMSVGTISVVQVLADVLGLGLKDAKDAVDACVFKGETASFHVSSADAGERLCQALSALEGPPRIHASMSIDPSAVREFDRLKIAADEILRWAWMRSVDSIRSLRPAGD